MISHKTLIYLIVLLSIHTSFSQNLVSNGSFEEYTYPSSNLGQTWQFIDDWSNVTFTTLGLPSPDYYHLNPNVGHQAQTFPIIYGSEVLPHVDSAMCGFIAYNEVTEVREYLSTQLTTPLEVGATYEVSFWITNGEKDSLQTLNTHSYSCDGIGIDFSVNPPFQSGYGAINSIPECEISGEVWSPNWEQHTFYLVADFPYNYITIGSFHNDANVSASPHSPYIYTTAYYFIDDIKIIKVEPTIVSETSKGNFNIYPNPTTDELQIIGLENEIPYTIVSNFGQVILKGTTSKKINLVNLPAGNYILLIGENEVLTRFIKK